MEEVVDHQIADDDFVWLEILSRHHDVIARHRLYGSDLRVGRGYGNDVVLDDPYVAPWHLRIVRDADGEWIAEDLGSAGGLFAERDKHPQQRIRLDGDRVIRIGQTHLRLRRPSHEVAAERLPQRTGRMLLVALALGAVVLGLTALEQWLGETGEPKASRYLVPLLSLPLVVLAWSGLWAILTRIFSGQARFERHLLIAVIAVLVSWLIEEGGALLAFAGSWPWLATYDYVGSWLLGAVTVFFHLRVIGPSHLRLKGGLVAALMVTGILIQSLSLFDGRDQPTRREEVRLMPPMVRLVPLRSEAAFFGDIERLEGQLERDREKPAAEDEDSFDDDD